MSELRERRYRWHGIDKSGQKCQGELSAWDVTEIFTRLKHQGICVTQVRPVLLVRLCPHSTKVKRSIITHFIRQLAILIHAGVPLVSALTYLQEHQTQTAMKVLLTKLSEDITQGCSLAEAFAARPSLAEPLLVSSIASAEQAGALDSMLTELAQYREKLEKLYTTIKKAMFYPCLVLMLGFLISIGLLVYVVPAFKQMYANFGASLPVATQLVLSISAWLSHYLWIGLLLLFCCSVWIVKLARKNDRVIYFVDACLLKCYILGAILNHACISRFCYSLGLMFSAGVPIAKALPTISKSMRHVVMKQALMKAYQSLLAGQSLHIALWEQHVFPPLLIQMIAAGEASGALDAMLVNMANYYSEQVDLAVSQLTTLIEPAMMIILGVLIGGLVIAMYLPIFQMGQMV